MILKNVYVGVVHCSQCGGLLESGHFFQDLCFQIHAFPPPPQHSHKPFDRLRKDRAHNYMDKKHPRWIIHSQILLHIAVTWGPLKVLLMLRSYPVPVTLPGNAPSSSGDPSEQKARGTPAWLECRGMGTASNHLWGFGQVSLKPWFLIGKMRCLIKCYMGLVVLFIIELWILWS